MDHNPHLTPWRRPQPDQAAGKGRIEQPDTPGSGENLVWQTRAAPPTDYENALADALVACFEDGVSELAALVDRLNAQGVRGPDGLAWTVDRFEREMARLGG